MRPVGGLPPSVVSVLPEILRETVDPTAWIRIHVLPLPPEGTQRIVKREHLSPLIESALRIRAQYHVPFWDAVLLLSERESIDVRFEILDAVGLHQSMQMSEVHSVQVSDISPQSLRDFAAARSTDQIVALSSVVVNADGKKIGHLPMLDFRMKVSQDNARMAEAIVKRLGCRGALFASGNSYHFYGSGRLLAIDDLAAFLGRAALFAPFVDQRWIGHQLIEGACALRISSGKTFSEAPEFVSWIG